MSTPDLEDRDRAHDRARREELIELRRRRKFDEALDARASDPDAPDPVEVCRTFDPPPGYDEASVRRCPGCGGKVFRWPCLVCQLRGHLPADTGAEP